MQLNYIVLHYSVVRFNKYYGFFSYCMTYEYDLCTACHGIYDSEISSFSLLWYPSAKFLRNINAVIFVKSKMCRQADPKYAKG